MRVSEEELAEKREQAALEVPKRPDLHCREHGETCRAVRSLEVRVKELESRWAAKEKAT